MGAVSRVEQLRSAFGVIHILPLEREDAERILELAQLVVDVDGGEDTDEIKLYFEIGKVLFELADVKDTVPTFATDQEDDERLFEVATELKSTEVRELAFVALGSKAPPVVRFGSAVVAVILVLAIVRFAPSSMEAYSRLYVGGAEGKLSAPGAIVQVGVLAIAGVIYLLSRNRWAAVTGESPLLTNLAWGALACLPLILISSVGAYRFALYFWPLGMYVYSGFPTLIPAATGRAFYRIAVVICSFAMLIGWLLLANNSLPWLPYKNWLTQSDTVSLIRYAPYKRD